MFEIIDIEQRSEVWIQFRKQHIGSSDASAILGVSTWKSPYDLWLEKTNLDLSEKYVSPAMQRGIDLEPKALECFNHYMGETFEPKVMVSLEYPWMSASLDGFCWKKDMGVVEIKAPKYEYHKMAVDGKVPEIYKPQLQHIMAITGLEFAYYFSFDGEDGVIVKVDRDQVYIDDLIAKEKEFWECVQTLTEPKSKYIERNDKEWEAASGVYKESAQLEERARIVKEHAKATLIQFAGDHSHCRGGGISISKVQRSGTIDFGAVPELQNVDLEPFRKKSVEYWKVDIC